MADALDVDSPRQYIRSDQYSVLSILKPFDGLQSKILRLVGMYQGDAFVLFRELNLLEQGICYPFVFYKYNHFLIVFFPLKQMQQQVDLCEKIWHFITLL